MTEDKRVEQLEKDLEAMRKDFKSFNENLKGIAAQKTSEIETRARQVARKTQNKAEQLWDDVSETGADIYDRARDQIEDTVDSINRRVREKPLSSIAIVAGVSYIIGFLSRK